MDAEWNPGQGAHGVIKITLVAAWEKRVTKWMVDGYGGAGEIARYLNTWYKQRRAAMKVMEAKYLCEEFDTLKPEIKTQVKAILDDPNNHNPPEV